MNNKQQKDSIDNQNIAEQRQQIQVKLVPKNKICSEYLEQYTKFFQGLPKLQIQEIKSLLTQNQIKWNDDFQLQLTSKIIDTDFQSMTVEISLGYFIVKVQLINLFIDFDFQQGNFIGSGGFGSIYGFRTKQNQLAVKVIKIEQQKYSQKYLHSFYKELVISKIASILKIGPKILTPFMYDAIVLPKKAFFCLEKCQNLFNVYLQNKSVVEINNHLKTNLYTLHQLHICHCDIKKQNIMWSQFYDKQVIIDYGLSRFVNQNIGQKSIMHFVGTYSHVYEQMKKLFYLKNKGLVDLYYNDVHGLQQCLMSEDSYQKLKEQKLENNIRWIPLPQNSYQLQNFSRVISIKYLSRKKNWEDVIKILKNQKIMLKTLHQILSGQKTELLFKDFSAQSKEQKIKILTQRLKKNKLKTWRIDNILYKNESQRNNMKTNYSFFQIGYLLNLDQKIFKQILFNKDLIFKLYELLTSSKFYSKNQKKQDFGKKRLIEKMSGIIQTQKRNKMYIQRVRQVCHFFYKYFVECKFIKGLEQLFQISISMNDVPFSRQIQLRMMQLQKDQTKINLLKLHYSFRNYFYSSNFRDMSMFALVKSISIQNPQNLYNQQNNIDPSLQATIKIAQLFLQSIKRYGDAQIFIKTLKKLQQQCQFLENIISEPLYKKLILQIQDIINKTKRQSNIQIKSISLLQIQEHHKKLNKINALRAKLQNKCNLFVFPSLNNIFQNYFNTLKFLQFVNKPRVPNQIYKIIDFYFVVYQNRSDLMDDSFLVSIRINLAYNFHLTYYFIQKYTKNYPLTRCNSEMENQKIPIFFIIQLFVIVIQHSIKQQNKNNTESLQCRQLIKALCQKMWDNKNQRWKNNLNISFFFISIQILDLIYLQKFQDALLKLLSINSSLNTNNIYCSYLIGQLKRISSIYIKDNLDKKAQKINEFIIKKFWQLSSQNNFCLFFGIIRKLQQNVTESLCLHGKNSQALGYLIKIVQNLQVYQNMLFLKDYCEQIQLGVKKYCSLTTLSELILTLDNYKLDFSKMSANNNHQVYLVFSIIDRIVQFSQSSYKQQVRKYLSCNHKLQKMLQVIARCLSKINSIFREKIITKYYGVYYSIFQSITRRKKRIIKIKDVRLSQSQKSLKFIQEYTKKAKISDQAYWLIKLKLKKH